MKPVKLDDLTQDALDQLSVRSYACFRNIIKNITDIGLRRSLCGLRAGRSRLTFEMNIGYENFQSQPFLKHSQQYKSLVRWGQKNLSFSHVNKDNPCRDSFLQVKAFHKKLLAAQPDRMPPEHSI